MDREPSGDADEDRNEVRDPRREAQLIASRVLAVLERAGLGSQTDELVRLCGLLEAPQVVVAVVGDAKQGKTSVVNGLLGGVVLPTSDDLGTTVPTVVHHYLGDSQVTVTVTGRVGGSVVSRAVEPEALPSLATSFGNELNRLRLARVTVGVASPFLARGIVVVDLPPRSFGVGRDPGGLTTVADLVVLVVEAGRTLSVGEIEALERFAARGVEAVVVVAKLDQLLHPESAAPELERQLDERGLPNRVIGTSFAWRALADSAMGGPGWEEASGFRTLVGAIEEGARRPAQDIVILRLLAEAAGLVSLARAAVGAERAATDHLAAASATAVGIREVAANLARAGDGRSPWVQVLVDALDRSLDAARSTTTDQLTGLTRQVAPVGDPAEAAAMVDEVRGSLAGSLIEALSRRSLDLRAELATTLIERATRDGSVPLLPALAGSAVPIAAQRWPAGAAWATPGGTSPVLRWLDGASPPEPASETSLRAAVVEGAVEDRIRDAGDHLDNLAADLARDAAESVVAEISGRVVAFAAVLAGVADRTEAIGFAASAPQRSIELTVMDDELAMLHRVLVVTADRSGRPRTTTP